MQSMHYTLRSYCLKQYLMELSFAIIIQYIYIYIYIYYEDLTKSLFIIDSYTFMFLCRISNIRMMKIFVSLYDHGYLDLCTCHFSLSHCENVQFSNKPWHKTILLILLQKITGFTYLFLMWSFFVPNVDVLFISLWWTKLCNLNFNILCGWYGMFL